MRGYLVAMHVLYMLVSQSHLTFAFGVLKCEIIYMGQVEGRHYAHAYALSIWWRISVRTVMRLTQDTVL